MDKIEVMLIPHFEKYQLIRLGAKSAESTVLGEYPSQLDAFIALKDHYAPSIPLPRWFAVPTTTNVLTGSFTLDLTELVSIQGQYPAEPLVDYDLLTKRTRKGHRGSRKEAVTWARRTRYAMDWWYSLLIAHRLYLRANGVRDDGDILICYYGDD